MIIEVNNPFFEYLINDPTQVRYSPSDIISEYRKQFQPSDKWRLILVENYLSLPQPKEGEILYEYSYNRGYLLKTNNNEQTSKHKNIL